LRAWEGPRGEATAEIPALLLLTLEQLLRPASNLHVKLEFRGAPAVQRIGTACARRNVL
jgi:hypothetical protein